jgi:1-acyl-sn-glycerol-3-phosphate acyltransferase
MACDPRPHASLQTPGTPLSLLRNRTFDLLIATWTALFLPAIGVLLVLGKPRAAIRAVSRVWASGLLAILRWTVGITHVELGRANIPAGPCLVVANHQSQWETIAFLLLMRDVAIVAKQELLAVPVMGWFLRHSPMILIDRDSGGKALRHMLSAARTALDEGRPVLVFPEGTRRVVGSDVAFKRGVELLYAQLAVPVLPVAVNSGLFWTADPRVKRAGAITVTYLPVIEPGLPGAEFLSRAQRCVQAALAEPAMSAA